MCKHLIPTILHFLMIMIIIMAMTMMIPPVWNLQQTHIVNHSDHGAITCLWFTEDYQFLLIGSADGTISIGTDPDARWKLLHAAIQKTPLLGPTL